MCFRGKNLKVLHIGEVAGLGGLQNWVCSVAEAQARRGYEVELMQPPWVDVNSQALTHLPAGIPLSVRNRENPELSGTRSRRRVAPGFSPWEKHRSRSPSGGAESRWRPQTQTHSHAA